MNRKTEEQEGQIDKKADIEKLTALKYICKNSYKDR